MFASCTQAKSQRLDLPVHDLVLVAEKGGRAPELTVPPARRRNAPRDNAEFAVLRARSRLGCSGAVAGGATVFCTANRQAFDSLVESDGDLEIALDRLDGQARDVVERAAIVDVVVDAPMEARVLIAAAVRRELSASFQVQTPRGSRVMRRLVDLSKTCKIHIEPKMQPNGYWVGLSSAEVPMGPREDESPAVLACGWLTTTAALVARGRTQGVVHAEDVAHVVRDVELTPDVLISVSDALAKLGIEIDDAVEVEADHDATPASGRRRRRQMDDTAGIPGVNGGAVRRVAMLLRATECGCICKRSGASTS